MNKNANKKELIEELLLYGASLSFTEQFTNIDQYEFARHRDKLGILSTTAFNAPSIEESSQIETIWSQLSTELSEVEKYLLTAQKLHLSISTIHTHHKSMGSC